ncbi:MAG: hypothetical protein IPM69_01065 [Ignavibacteria bacterium]|nr:hypothetical protein [Ignavibacteria bacterium]
MKYFAVVLLFISISPLLGQTKVWEATSPTTIDYIAISQDGSILATLSQKTLSVWRTDSSSAVKKINISPTSNPVISNNNNTNFLNVTKLNIRV